MKYLIISSLLLLNCICSLSQNDTLQNKKNRGGILYGSNYAYGFSTPSGWVLDTKSGKDSDLDAVFYPAGSNWKDAVTVMYATATNKSIKGNETIEKVIEYDIWRYKSNSDNIKITDSDSLETSDHKWAKVKLFLDYNTGGNFESVAYIDEAKVVSVLVITSRTEDDLNNNLPKFKDLVRSYFHVSDTVIIGPKK